MSGDGAAMDEFDVEVTPLDGSSPVEDEQQHTGSEQASDTNGVATSAAPVSVSGVALRQRERVLRASVVTVTVLITLVALLLTPAGTRSAVFQLLAGPTATPTPTLLPGGDLLLWEHTVSWGTLLIDGRRGPDVGGPSASYDQKGEVQAGGFHLARGRHTLDYRAALFPMLHCSVSVPRAATDTCPLDIQNTFPFILRYPGIRVLDMQATVDRLQAGQAKALVALTQDALDTEASAVGKGALARGDHFLAADGRSTLVADGPLTVQARFSLADSTTLDQSVEVGHCALLCSSDDLFAPTLADAWSVYAPVELTWYYVGADGRVVLDSGPATGQESRRSVVVAVAAQWEKNQWQVRLAPAELRLHSSVMCQVGGHALDVLRSTSFATTDITHHVQWPYEAPVPGLGCLLAGSRTVDTAGNLSGAIALVLYHCGVLLGVNAEAQRIFPGLPYASAHERALARAVAPPGVMVSS